MADPAEKYFHYEQEGRLPANIINIKEFKKLRDMNVDELVVELENDMFQLNMLENGFKIKGYDLRMKLISGLTRMWYKRKYNIDALVEDYVQQVKLDREGIEKRMDKGEHPNKVHQRILDSDDIKFKRQFVIRQTREAKKDHIRQKKYDQQKLKLRETAAGIRDDIGDFLDRLNLKQAALVLASVVLFSGSGFGVYKSVKAGGKYSEAAAAYAADPNGANALRWDGIEGNLSRAWYHLDYDETLVTDYCTDGDGNSYVCGSHIDYDYPYPRSARQDLQNAINGIREEDNESKLRTDIGALRSRIPDKRIVHHDAFRSEQKSVKSLESRAENKEAFYDSQVPIEIRENKANTRNTFILWLMGTILTGIGGFAAGAKFINDRRYNRRYRRYNRW